MEYTFFNFYSIVRRHSTLCGHDSEGFSYFDIICNKPLLRSFVCCEEMRNGFTAWIYAPHLSPSPSPLYLFFRNSIIVLASLLQEHNARTSQTTLSKYWGLFSTKKGMLHTKITLIKYKHYKITNLKLNNKTNHLIKRLLHDGSKHYLKKTQKSNFGKYSKNLRDILLS